MIRKLVVSLAVLLACVGAATPLAGIAQAAAVSTVASPSASTGSASIYDRPCNLYLIYSNCASDVRVVTYLGFNNCKGDITIYWGDGSRYDGPIQDRAIKQYIFPGTYQIRVVPTCTLPSHAVFTLIRVPQPRG